MNDDDAEHFEMYLEDTNQQIDAFYETLTSWEQDPAGEAWRRESLRLLHAMEGAAGAMAFENVRALTLDLNRQFDRVCSRDERIDPSDMRRLLRGIEFLRDCNDRLRAGESLDNSAELLEQLKAAQQ
jgi:chemotaxis protein histidine kinase CheA